MTAKQTGQDLFAWLASQVSERVAVEVALSVEADGSRMVRIGDVKLWVTRWEIAHGQEKAPA